MGWCEVYRCAGTSVPTGGSEHHFLVIFQFVLTLQTHVQVCNYWLKHTTVFRNYFTFVPLNWAVFMIIRLVQPYSENAPVAIYMWQQLYTYEKVLKIFPFSSSLDKILQVINGSQLYNQ